MDTLTGRAQHPDMLSPAARVVATVGPIASIAPEGARRFVSNQEVYDTPAPTQSDSKDEDTTPHGYEPYVHTQTGERAMVPIRIDPTTNARVPMIVVPSDLVPIVFNNMVTGKAEKFPMMHPV